MTLAIQLVTYNGAEYLPTLFESLVSQKDRDWTLYVFENMSAQRNEIRALVHEFRAKLPIVYVESDKNIGFAGGHQKLFTMHDADLVTLVNPDVILMPNFIEKQRAIFESCPNLGSASGVIYRWNFEADRPALSNVVDSLGLVELVNGKVVDRGAGELVCENVVDSLGLGEFVCNNVEPLLGVSGCLPTYRREAVESSSHDRLLFYPMYESYKEDVDLAYRLKRSGWRSKIVADAHAYHKRTFNEASNREHISYSVQFWSYRNHLWNLLTHTSARDMVKRGWAIVPFELAKAGYFAFTNPRILIDTARDTFKYYPEIKKKRSWYAKRTH